MGMNGLQVDMAKESDINAIADLQIASWRFAYRGMLPDAFLGEPVEAVLRERWARLPVDPWRVVVARRGTDILGVSSIDLSSEPGAYIDNFHVHPDTHRGGIGRALLIESARVVQASARDQMWLTVIDANHQARQFYRALGGAEGLAEPDLLYGNPIVSLPVTWPDLEAISALNSP
ncbi:MAG: GNAT family N-acetyltransferase [Pseudomonadota bacterium]